MTYTKGGNGLQQYKQVGLQASIDAADPHRLIQMLMEGALEKIAKAKQFMMTKNTPEKGRHVSWAISIIDGLRLSLDKEKGGDIAQNLDALYDYMTRRLVLANVQNDATILDEVTSLLFEVKSGWDAIPEAVRRNPSAASPTPSTPQAPGKHVSTNR